MHVGNELDEEVVISSNFNVCGFNLLGMPILQKPFLKVEIFCFET